MTRIELIGSRKALAYIELVAQEISVLFPVSHEEAVGRVNRFWHGQAFVTPEDLIALLHEEPEYWAKTIYYGPDTFWWLGEEGLDPKPYP